MSEKMKKITKRILSMVLAFVMIFGAAPLSGFIGLDLFEAHAATGDTLENQLEGDYTYNVVNGEAVITSYSYSGDEQSEITVPETLGGYPVTKIGENAYISVPCTKIIIPSTVKIIAQSNFKYCYGLKEIVVSPDSLYFSSLDGVLFNKDKTELIFYPEYKPMADVYELPSTVVKIGDEAFFARDIKTLILSDALTTIGANAFASSEIEKLVIGSALENLPMDSFSEMLSLAEIEVSAQNKKYSSVDGVLFNKNVTELILCPLGKGSMLNRYIYTVPNTVVRIGDKAFYGTSAYSIIIPDSVKYIGNEAFCSDRIAEITIGSGAESIAPNALRDATYLKSITVSAANQHYVSDDNVLFNKDHTELIKYAFERRERSYTVPSSVKKISDGAFSQTLLNKVVLNEGLTEIGNSAFAYNSLLCDVKLPSTLKTIGAYAFKGTAILGMDIPDSVTAIGEGAFAGCLAIKTLILPEGLTILNDIFDVNDMMEVKIYIPSSVESIGGNLLSQIQYELIKPYINKNSYAETLFKEYNIKYKIIAPCESFELEYNKIHAYTYEDCTYTNIFIDWNSYPENSLCVPSFEFDSTDCYIDIFHMGAVMFGSLGNHKLTAKLGDITKTCNFEITNVTETDLISYGVTPNSEVSIFRDFSYAISPDVTVASTIEGLPVTEITSMAYSAEPINSIVIPGSVKRIGMAAFNSCENLTSITLNEGLKEIGTAAFTSTAITKINIPSTVTKFGDLPVVYDLYGEYIEGEYSGAFMGSQIYDYTFNSDIMPIMRFQVMHTGRVTFGENVKKIRNGAFAQCSVLREVNFPESLEEIGAEAFSGTALVGVVIPDNVKKIGEKAFYNNKDLESVELSKSLQEIGDNAFALTSSLFEIAFPTSLKKIGYMAFYGSKISEVVIPEGTEYIGPYAFSYCYNLGVVKIPKSVKSMDTQPFYECQNITDVYYDGTQQEWEALVGLSNAGINTNVVMHFAAEPVAPEKLQTPEIVSAFSRAQNSVKITWKSVPGADGYKLYRSENPNDGFKCVKTVKDSNATYYTNGGLTEGKTYYYKLQAYKVGADGKWTYSDFSNVDFMPAAVVFTNVYSNATYRIRSLWNVVGGAEGYQLWRADSPDGEYKIVKTIKAGDIDAYSNTGLESGKNYSYKMRAYYTKPSGEKIFGAFSDVQTVAVMPETPAVTVYSNGVQSARIKWNSINGAAGYQIWRADASGNYTLVKSVTDPNATGYTNKGLKSGEEYTYKVRAYTEVNGKKTFGAYSNPVNVTVK